MKWIGAIVREVFGLFVDDGSFAVAILVWLALVGLGLPQLGIAAGWDGLLLVCWACADSGCERRPAGQAI